MPLTHIKGKFDFYFKRRNPLEKLQSCIKIDVKYQNCDNLNIKYTIWKLIILLPDFPTPLLPRTTTLMRLRLVILGQRWISSASRFAIIIVRRVQHVGPAGEAEQRTGLYEDRAGTEVHEAHWLRLAHRRRGGDSPAISLPPCEKK